MFFVFFLHYAYGVKRHSPYLKSDHNSSVLCTTFYTSCIRMHRCLPVILSLSLPRIWRCRDTENWLDMIPKIFLSDTEMIPRMYRWEFLGHWKQDQLITWHRSGSCTDTSQRNICCMFLFQILTTSDSGVLKGKRLIMKTNL